MLTINFFGKNIVVENVILARVIFLVSLALALALIGFVVYLLVVHWIIGLIVAVAFVGSAFGAINTLAHQKRQQSTYPF